MTTTSSVLASRRLVLLCLAVALVLVAAIAWEAFRSARARRAAVESVLEGYARLAAEQFARSAALTIDYGWAYPVMRLVGVEGAGPPRLDAELRIQYETVRMSDLAVRFFELAMSPDAKAQRPTTAWSSTLGDDDLENDLRASAERLRREDWRFCAVVDERSGSARIFFLSLLPDGPSESTASLDTEVRRQPRLRGFEGAPAMLLEMLRATRRENAVLPESLTRGRDATGLVSITVTTAGGRELFRDGPSSADFVASESLGARLGDLRVQAGIPSSAAQHLVIGGLPPSRAPLIGGLLLVAVGMVLAAVMLLRRERELVRLRERFVAGASHELRTPLAQIRMFAETLRLDRVRSEEERYRYLEVIDREAHRLSLLVDNLLEFSRSSRGAERFSPEELDLAVLLKEVAEGFEPVAREREARIEVHTPPSMPARLDRDLFRQMLLNLLDNAIKYGPAGQTVTVATHRLAQDGVEVSVSDQGPGVAAEHRARVWERFWRAPEARGTTGSGIGLAVVEELVRLHGGSATVGPASGGGARFALHFPAVSR